MIQIYTDGSKGPETGKTGATTYIPKLQISIKKGASDHLAVLSVKLLVVILGLLWAEEVKPNQVGNVTHYTSYLMCSNSMAALISIRNCKSVCRPDLM